MAYDPALQIALDELWFRLPVSTPIAERERRQRWLVREFQIYARGQFAAEEQGAINGPINADNLRQKALSGATRLPAGVPHGDADAATLAAIKAWQAARLRCPVIFQARTRRRTDLPDHWNVLVDEGFIFHDQLQDAKPRVFARDYTDRWPLNPDGTTPAVPVGTAITYATRWGSAAKKSHSLGAEITPDRLAGANWATLLADQKATFRVVAALATVESECVFDGINSYDMACLSAGPFHYTAFPGMKPFVGDAELAAFLAYLRSENDSVFKEYFGQFGLRATAGWAAKMRSASDRVFRAELGFVDSAGQFPSITEPADRNWIRNWHSFYRIQYALRSSLEIRGLFWPYTRQRLADLLSTPWSGAEPPGAAMIGDVFKSERSIALLARWHVYRPAHVVSDNKAAVVPIEVVRAAGLSKKKVSTWTSADEALLAAAFITTANGSQKMRASNDLRKTLTVLMAWRRTEWSDGVAGPTLRASRDFVLDQTKIPFPPPVLVLGKTTKQAAKRRSAATSRTEGKE